MVPIVSIVGRSNSGKTTLIEKLIPELNRRGYRVGTIKHHFHSEAALDIDREGKDSWRHKKAGAVSVVLSSAKQVALIRDVQGEISLDEAVEKLLGDVDLVLTEGFKEAHKPKIEVNRKAQGLPPLCNPADDLVALVADHNLDLGVPRFGLDDIAAIANLIEEKFLRPAGGASVPVCRTDFKSAERG